MLHLLRRILFRIDSEFLRSSKLRFDRFSKSLARSPGVNKIISLLLIYRKARAFQIKKIIFEYKAGVSNSFSLAGHIGKLGTKLVYARQYTYTYGPILLDILDKFGLEQYIFKKESFLEAFLIFYKTTQKAVPGAQRASSGLIKSAPA